MTVSAPHSVPVLSPVVTVSNSVFLGAGATIVSGQVVALGASGGGLHAEPDALLNETWSRGTADLRDRVQVRGTLHAATVTFGNSVQAPMRDTAPAFDPLNTLTWSVKYPSSTAGSNVTVNTNESVPLAPGQYGDVNANSQGTITLRTGTYYLRSLTLQSSSTVKLDQAAGPVIIYVETGSMALRGVFTSLDANPPDLLIVYLGTTSFLVETLFNGAIIAPSTMMTLRAMSAAHTGFFYAKDFQILDAHAQVQYRAPLPVVTAAGLTGAACSAVVTALVPAASLQSSLNRYCGTCASPADTDRDGTQDCLDGCPYDAAKTAPGLCGCGSTETDTDGDKVPNCLDRCPNDPNNVAPGQCGCAGEPNLQPAGTPCSDTACQQIGATCNGAGVCGNRTTCLPATGCKVVTFRGSTYWLCLPAGSTGGATATPLTQTAAQQACSAKGAYLARVDSLEDNRFLASFLTAPAWIGANDISTNAVWRWSLANSNNGGQFWSGTSTGSRVGARFYNWSPGAPGAARCAAMMEKDGRWTDVSCTQSLGYICEFRPPLTRTTTIVPPGMPHQPPQTSTACITEAQAALPGPGMGDVLIQQIQAANQNMPAGAAANPPASGTCPDDPLSNGLGFTQKADEGCQLTSVVPGSSCVVDADCNQYGAGFLCREQKQDVNCTPTNSGTIQHPGSCPGNSRCGKVVCPVAGTPCDQREICNPSAPAVTAVLDNPSPFAPQELTAPSLFNGVLPNSAPSSTYSDPPHGADGTRTGKNHAWCANSPRSVSAAEKHLPDTEGRSGTNSMIQFKFSPGLTFDANPKALAQGETNVHLHAAGRLAASVNITGFLGQNFTTSIFDASIGMVVDRCALNNVDDTQVSIFGVHLLDPAALGLPVVDSRSATLNRTLYDLSNSCTQGLDKFQLYADRAKKAFRDGQQLVQQYKSAKAVSKVLSSNLCNAVHLAAAVSDDFPGGDDCPADERAEVTIGRFLDYYQAPGRGQIAKLRNAQAELASATGKLKDLIAPLHLAFDGRHHEESQTILNVQFFIGPVPMVLQVDVFAQYGIGGGFDLKLSLPVGLVASSSDGSTPPPPVPVAKITASVVPYAAAGLSAFVGAGTNLGAFSATVGIEGALTLANLSAPIFAGVGLDVQALKDVRPIPSDVLAAVTGDTAFHFGIPTAFKFFVNYEYGAAVDLNNVLSGEINGKLRIKFLFFSRTWRKRIVKFTGWSQHFDLIKAGADLAVFSTSETAPAHLPTADNSADTVGTSTNVSAGDTAAGLSEAQVPLMVLDAPPISIDPVAAGTPVQEFDASQVDQLSYDALCCSKLGETCQSGFAGRPQCCPGTQCNAPAGTGGVVPTGTCIAQCKNEGVECRASADCCQPAAGTGQRAKVCGSLSVCAICAVAQEPCTTTSDCCGGYSCNATTNVCEQIIG